MTEHLIGQSRRKNLDQFRHGSTLREAWRSQKPPSLPQRRENMHSYWTLGGSRGCTVSSEVAARGCPNTTPYECLHRTAPHGNPVYITRYLSRAQPNPLYMFAQWSPSGDELYNLFHTIRRKLQMPLVILPPVWKDNGSRGAELNLGVHLPRGIKS